VPPDLAPDLVPIPAADRAPDVARSTLAKRTTSASLGEIVRGFKAVSTRLIRQTGQTDFAWQRNYYEHVIRDEAGLLRIRRYIEDNPTTWQLDQLHPDNPSTW
jgi:REP element-mobilizing transposase RayT